jgi:TolA-binding protein
MNSTLVRMTLGALLLSIVALVGCDTKESAPTPSSFQRLEYLTMSSDDEREAVTAVEVARTDYKYRLEVLQAYYNRVGNIDRYNWASNELANLQEAQVFRWRGIPEVRPPAGETLADANEQVLVEYLFKARRTYRQSLQELASFYDRGGQDFKAKAVRNIQNRLDPVRMYTYLPGAELPPADLRPTEVSTEANALYEQAFAQYQQGKGVLRTFITTDYQKQRRALALFRDLIERYPRSDKIALSAYYIGEIYKEYFNEDVRAVAWYERAWTWDPRIPKPARFQAATVWDLRLKNRAKAIECYKLAIKYEQFNQSNVSFAIDRVRDLESGN